MANVANLTTSFAMESTNFVTGAATARNALKQLQNQLDPAGKAQAAFNRQIEQAKQLYDGGAISLERYEFYTDAAAKKLQTMIQRQQVGVQASGQMRAGFQQLSYQIGDVATGFATGQHAMQIFAQQSTQVVQAMQLMAGESKGLVGLLAGPWGLAFTAAITVATSLAGTLFQSKDAGKAAEEGYRAAADGADRLFDALKRVNTMGTTVAQQDAIDIQDQINKKQYQIADIEKQIDATRGTRRVINPLGVAERFFDTKDLNAAKAQLQTLQDSLQIAKARLSAQDRINAAQDKYEQGLKNEAASRKAANKEAREAESAARKAAREALADAKAQADLVAKASAGAYKAIAGLESDQHKNLMSLFADDAGAWDDMAKNAQTAFSAMQDQNLADEHDLQRIREGHIRDLAGLYQDLFTGGTKALWRDFEREGFQIISQLLAKWTVGMSSAQPGSGGGIGGLLGSIGGIIGGIFGGGGGGGAALGGFNVGSIATDIPFAFANGGSFEFGGKGGIDQNILSLNGSPIAKVSQGETATISPRGRGGGQTIHQTFDMRGAVVTQELLAQVNAQAMAGTATALGHRDKKQAKAATRRLGR